MNSTMTDESTIAHSEPSPWLVYGLRLTAFTSPSAQIDSMNWWSSVVGELPESQQSSPKTGRKREVGPFEGSRLILEVQPSRIDWRLTSLSDDQPGPTSREELLPLQSTVESFLRIANGWFVMAPPLIRLAFGSHLGIPVDDRSAGYQLLAKYLPSVQLDPSNSSDFIYQINRSRVSTVVPNLKLNRLSKWSVAVASLGVIAFQGENRAAANFTHQFFSCHLELDINTAADNTDEFQREHLPSQFLELIQLGEEIAHRGDIP